VTPRPPQPPRSGRTLSPRRGQVGSTADSVLPSSLRDQFREYDALRSLVLEAETSPVASRHRRRPIPIDPPVTMVRAATMVRDGGNESFVHAGPSYATPGARTALGGGGGGVGATASAMPATSSAPATPHGVNLTVTPQSLATNPFLPGALEELRQRRDGDPAALAASVRAATTRLGTLADAGVSFHRWLMPGFTAHAFGLAAVGSLHQEGSRHMYPPEGGSDAARLAAAVERTEQNAAVTRALVDAKIDAMHVVRSRDAARIASLAGDVDRLTETHGVTTRELDSARAALESERARARAEAQEHATLRAALESDNTILRDTMSEARDLMNELRAENAQLRALAMGMRAEQGEIFAERDALRRQVATFRDALDTAQLNRRFEAGGGSLGAAETIDALIRRCEALQTERDRAVAAAQHVIPAEREREQGYQRHSDLGLHHATVQTPGRATDDGTVKDTTERDIMESILTHKFERSTTVAADIEA
jgi:hypothetical protein